MIFIIRLILITVILACSSIILLLTLEAVK